MIPLNLIEWHERPIFQQLQLEEALLRTDGGNWCLINQGTTPAIVMGISGKPEKWIHPAFFERKPFPLIRRFSGGGTVVVDKHTLFVTFICNKADINIPPFPEHVLHWTGEIYTSLFNNLPFRVEENDYVFTDKKFGGNAQYFCKDRWLHHTSFLWDYDSEQMKYLLLPEKTPVYREKRAHDNFLCKMKDFVPCRKELIQNFKEVLSRQFALKAYPPQMLAEILKRPHRKSSTAII